MCIGISGASSLIKSITPPSDAIIPSTASLFSIFTWFAISSYMLSCAYMFIAAYTFLPMLCAYFIVLANSSLSTSALLLSDNAPVPQ